MDGNHSAKCIDGSSSTDPQDFRSDYFIHNDVVEQFRDDVGNCPSERSANPNPSCMDNWTAAKTYEEDKILVFEQTSIFLMACCHGFVEYIIEMKRSGELVKYGLAAINKMLDVYQKDQALGHDIGCSSHKTVAASSIGAKADEHNLIIAVSSPTAVNTFHGYAHNHPCWFLHNNYIQALRIINDFTPLLDDFKRHQSLTDEDFVRWKHEESEFLANLAREPPADVFVVTYVEELEKLQSIEAKYSSITSVPFLMYTPANFTASSGLNHRHGISKRWMLSDPHYEQALEYSGQRRFIRVVEELEALVIQHLFELSKANLSSTALDRYNKLAPLQVLPRPILEYTEVVGYAALGEFMLLKYSRHDLLAKLWAIPQNREMAVKFFKVLCAHKEIPCLNIEIGRLHAWMEFEDKSIVSAIAALNDQASPLLVSELQSQHAARRLVNNIHHTRLQKVCLLDGYTGALHSTILSRELTELDDEEEEDEDECSDEVHEEATRLADAVARM
ncbi:hypothetical protein DEU56DRAFT_873221 [Suillus clintonianus]|uniref:uncharacterized protein n=1 Tax=Suillus clintonianus TaxID=1904413 RepID=UPI001B8689C1|nr:uncharacterized protein DEU56DRAFT_873221 [Suillus clintonianus]KAG2124824.1 hypothetical protein DEU56DRAFT_873221 [Suillus clintonianus]